ncbi:hypothetical protein OC834_005861 [Tilletia horrida]|nr:hypothetical protein OC834_005861 [Tilletia horrida]
MPASTSEEIALEGLTSENRVGSGSQDVQTSPMDKVGVALLALQHASSSFGYRAAEFAFPLYFIQLFTNTLLPASLYGFVTTGAAIVFSGTVGHQLDGPRAHKRRAASREDESRTEGEDAVKDPTYQLRTIRNFILIQKLLVGVSYALFLIFFLQPGLSQEAENGGHGSTTRSKPYARPWTIFAAITLVGCGVILCNVGISVGVERAWVTQIARSNEARLITLNAIMRRIDLLSKLLAPLFVALLTSVTSYPTSAIVLLSINAGTAVFEWLWIKIVFARFPELEKWYEQDQDGATDGASVTAVEGTGVAPDHGATRRAGFAGSAERWVLEQWQDWSRFAQMPIFITYLKSETTYSDGFIAGMRGVGVVSGLLGTMVLPLLERLVGIVRAGTYSLFAQLLPLVMSLVSLYVGADQRERPAWNGALLFTGLALSRIGLWSFDLAQLTQVQRALDRAERKNALMGLQFALQNFFDLGHYALTIGWHRPDQFRYAAAVSFGSVTCATVLYTIFYARRIRGHLLHLDRLNSFWLRKDK